MLCSPALKGYGKWGYGCGLRESVRCQACWHGTGELGSRVRSIMVWSTHPIGHYPSMLPKFCPRMFGAGSFQMNIRQQTSRNPAVTWAPGWVGAGCVQTKELGYRASHLCTNISLVMAATLFSVEGGAGFEVSWTQKINDLDD